MIYIREFLISAMSVIGFGLIFNIPKNAFSKVAFAGAFGWITYIYFLDILDSSIGATFLGACIVAISSEILARIFKEAATVFVIPAIIPLVPGSGMYYSMLSIIENDYSRFASTATETLFLAGSISAGILIVSSITRIIMNYKINRL